MAQGQTSQFFTGRRAVILKTGNREEMSERCSFNLLGFNFCLLCQDRAEYKRLVVVLLIDCLYSN